MKKIVLILLTVVFLGPDKLQAQKIMTLKECYDQSYSTNALSGEKNGY